MILDKKYTTEADKLLPENKDKVVVTEEAYLLANVIENLIRSVERAKK